MIIQVNKTPFPHIIINDVYSENHLNLIWKETEFLYEKLGNEESTNAAMVSVDSQQRKKRGWGLFLDHVYLRRDVSDILNISRFPYQSDNVLEAIKNIDEIYFKLYEKCDWDATLLQYYGNGDYYDSHIDESLFTIIYTYYVSPKKFTGGDLAFAEYEYFLPCENNQMIIFPSCVQHQVTPVSLPSNIHMHGRFSIASLFDRIKNP